MPLTAAAVAEAKGKLVKKDKLATDKVADQEQLVNDVVEKSAFVSHNLDNLDEVEENGEFVEEDNVDQNKVEVSEILSEGNRELDHLVLHVQQDHGVGGVSVGKPGGAACSQEQEWMFRQVGNH